jgi:hypothetical protein
MNSAAGIVAGTVLGRLVMHAGSPKPDTDVN